MSLTDYFDEHCDEDAYEFTLSRVSPTCDRPTVIDAMAMFMARNKSDPEVTTDLLVAAGWETALAALRKGRVPVRRGDFAEVLAAEAADALDGLAVPVRKLRYQLDPNQTLPGSDVVGFVLDDDEDVEDLVFHEVKYRTDPDPDIAVEAHEQLANDRDTGYATTINFLANRLHELDHDLYKSFISFLASRTTKESQHTVVLAFEETNWNDDIAANLNDLPNHLPELWLRLFPLEEAAQLVEEVYAQLLWDVISDE